MRRFLLLSIGALTLIGCTQPSVVPVYEEPAASSSVAASVPSSAVSSMAQASSIFAAPTASSILLPLPFSPQAPYANWDAIHEEACEEMSLIMVQHALEGTGLTRDQAEIELQTMIAWEAQHGYGYDVTAAELAAIAKEYLGRPARVEENPSAERIREILREGHHVIAPMAGRELGNPYFSGDGPWYHMLVIRGYRTDWLGRGIFITNDPGTRRGEEYEYKEDVIMNALHDWTGVKERIAEGRKAIVVLE